MSYLHSNCHSRGTQAMKRIMLLSFPSPPLFFFFSPLASKGNGHLWLPLLISSWNLSNLSCIFSLNKFCFSFNLLPFVCTIHSISQSSSCWDDCNVKHINFMLSSFLFEVSHEVCAYAQMYMCMYLCVMWAGREGSLWQVEFEVKRGPLQVTRQVWILQINFWDLNFWKLNKIRN